MHGTNYLGAVALGILLSLGSQLKGDVTVSTGYYDLSPAASGGGPALPNPWLGSSNTTFYGSNSDLAAAASSDPDISAILLENNGATSVTLSALSLTPNGMDVLARATVPSGNLPVGSLTLLPGQNYIFSVGDGSDEGLGNQTVNLTLNGASHSFQDATNAQAPQGILFGDSPQLGGGDETQPWTELGEVTFATAAPLPASVSAGLLLFSVLFAMGILRRFKLGVS